MTRTEEMLNNMENEDFINNNQAAILASQAFKDYSKRSKNCKKLE